MDPDDPDQGVDFEELPTPTENPRTGEDQRSPPAEATRPSQVSVQDLLNSQEAYPHLMQSTGPLGQLQTRPQYMTPAPTLAPPILAASPAGEPVHARFSQASSRQPQRPDTPLELGTSLETSISPIQGIKFVPMIFDMFQDGFPFHPFSFAWGEAQASIPNPRLYRGFTSSKRWQWERMAGHANTKCVSLLMPNVVGLDPWILIRVGYDEGMALYSSMSHGSGNMSNFEWRSLCAELGDFASWLNSSRLRAAENGSEATQCVWFRTAEPGEDMFLLLCIGLEEGLSMSKFPSGS